MNIVVIDTRLAEDVVNFGAASHRVINVDGSTPMPYMMRQIKDAAADAKSKIQTLVIAAHGYAEEGIDGKAYDGFGMQLCKEDLDMQSVHFFDVLKGLFESRERGITLLGCGLAAQIRVKTKGGYKMGFGEDLCRQISRLTDTGVMASTARQEDVEGKVTLRIGGQIKTITAMDPGPWEGDVWIFTPDGSKAKARPK